MLGKFLTNRRGNIAIITALTIVPLIGISGGGVDVVRATRMDAKLSSALEGAVLAAANLNNSRDISTVVDEYLDANLQGDEAFRDGLIVDIDSTVNVNSRKVTVTAKGTIETYFLGVLAIDEIPITAQSTAEHTINDVEIALVLDVSGSMDSSDKIGELQAAAKDFVDEVVTADTSAHTSISLVPFNNSVNLGSDLFSDYVTTWGASTVDPTKSQYEQDSNLPYYSFRFNDGTRCIEYRNSDYHDGMLSANSRPEVPDIDGLCPPNDNEVFFNSNDVDELKDRIDDLDANGWTGMQIGMLWGAKALSPDWRGELGGDFADRPANYGADESIKVIVVMTDGQITDQYRPEDWRDPMGGYNVQYVSYAGSYNSIVDTDDEGEIESVDTTGNTGTAQFMRLCDEAAANGVIVYTIGFQINTSTDSDELLEYCASDASKYFLVEDLDIASAFETIANSVNALRITG